ncbi:hypothetical protein R70006_06240 [Paraburkholderia domus]|uniref:hypothetical protein n=1 Tax=Paraburkholderia domus TaxID=2793075 RepID=UPI001913C8AA|nr:hypothetical protein [Paraburkholderia domus]MBK5052871.1 hypothetical protein [Burkholderia sp. R-70006]CAE6821859.1 hypothetical protein R70006_06240 [Paraburkholderia domus]
MQKFPDTQATYGVVVTAATTSAELTAKRDVLKRMDADNIVLLSVEPHNVHARIDWPEIRAAFSKIPRARFSVEHIAQDEIARLARQMSVMQ